MKNEIKPAVMARDRLHVTQQDIDTARICSAKNGYIVCAQCAYAQAVMRQYAWEKPAVNHGGFVRTMNKLHFLAPLRAADVYTASLFISRFDDGLQVEPISVEVGLVHFDKAAFVTETQICELVAALPDFGPPERHGE